MWTGSAAAATAPESAVTAQAFAALTGDLEAFLPRRRQPGVLQTDGICKTMTDILID